MSKKRRFAFSVLSLAMSMTFLLLGVYAMQERKVSVAGTISFTSNNVYVNYTISKTDAYERDVANPTYINLENGAFDRSAIGQQSKTIAMSEVNVNDYIPKFSYRISLSRLDAEFVKQFYIVATLPALTPTQQQVFDVSITITGATQSGGYYTVTPAQSNVLMTVTYTVKEGNTVNNLTEIDLGETMFKLTVTKP